MLEPSRLMSRPALKFTVNARPDELMVDDVEGDVLCSVEGQRPRSRQITGRQGDTVHRDVTDIAAGIAWLTRDAGRDGDVGGLQRGGNSRRAYCGAGSRRGEQAGPIDETTIAVDHQDVEGVKQPFPALPIGASVRTDAGRASSQPPEVSMKPPSPPAAPPRALSVP